MVEAQSPHEMDATRLAMKLRATQAVLRWREAELLQLKGPCGSGTCLLHYAHSGPCDMKRGSE